VTARLNLLVIRVADLAASRAFYEALGLEFVLEKHGSGPEHLSCSRGGFVFEVYPRRSQADSTSKVRIGFSLPALHPLLDELRGIGAEFVSGPKESEWGRRLVLRDPDGHRVELLEVGYTVEDLSLVDPEGLARRQPRMFGLTPELPDWGQVLAERVVNDTQDARCEITAQKIGDWWVIAANRDWLRAHDGSLDLTFFRTAKALNREVNASRSEWLIHAYARTLVTVGPGGSGVLKGMCPASSEIWKTLTDLGATRAIAFEGVVASPSEPNP